jgi:hypothetical protein
MQNMYSHSEAVCSLRRVVHRCDLRDDPRSRNPLHHLPWIRDSSEVSSRPTGLGSLDRPPKDSGSLIGSPNGNRTRSLSLERAAC